MSSPQAVVLGVSTTVAMRSAGRAFLWRRRMDAASTGRRCDGRRLVLTQPSPLVQHWESPAGQREDRPRKSEAGDRPDEYEDAVDEEVRQDELLSHRTKLGLGPQARQVAKHMSEVGDGASCQRFIDPFRELVEIEAAGADVEV